MNRLESESPSLANPPSLPADYETDFVRWLDEQAGLLRARRLDLLDIDNLCEEIEGLARADRRELRNRLRVLLVHLLKFKFQPDHRSANWRGTLNEQRDRIALILRDSPSLNQRVMDYADEVYRRAVEIAADEIGLPPAALPPANPFSQTELLDPAFIP